MLKLVTQNVKKDPIDTLIILVSEDVDLYRSEILKRAVEAAKRTDDFHGGDDQNILLYDIAGLSAGRLLFVGLGPQKGIDAQSLRRTAAKAVRQCRKMKKATVTFAYPDVDQPAISGEGTLKALIEGALLANHRLDAYKSEPNSDQLTQIDIHLDAGKRSRFMDLARQTELLCRGTLQARDWVNLPSNDKTPPKLAGLLTTSAKHRALQTRVFTEAELKRQKFGALTAVAAGSHAAPRLVIMDYRPTDAQKTLALIGKGVTFDSGGLNLKTSKSLTFMKVDMAGAATVAATMALLPGLKPKLRVVGILPIVENMVSGSALRPGDVIRSYSGKTIEIGNTDAEGRLILADAIAYAIKKYKPGHIIDLATLTGACVTALGEGIAGVFSNDEDLSQAVIAAGDRNHERCWAMPMPEDYKKLLKSDIADINNMPATRAGAAITAALFLAEFAGDTPWVHIDIAGTAYQTKQSPTCDKGGTGFGVRLLGDLIQRL